MSESVTEIIIWTPALEIISLGQQGTPGTPGTAVDVDDFLRKDGTVALTGNQSAGGFKITNVGTPTPGSADAARILDVETAVAGLSSAYKYRTVRVKATGPVTISNPGTANFDGVTLTSGDALLGSILLASQAAPEDNGLYLFNGAASPLTRLSNSDAFIEFPGSLVYINEGTLRQGTRWQCTTDDGGTLGVTAITYTQDVQAPAGGRGVAVIDFGASGKDIASLAITGQTGILSGSAIIVSILAIPSADHSADEHIAEEIDVFAGDIIAGTGFTIYTRTRSLALKGAWNVAWIWS